MFYCVLLFKLIHNIVIIVLTPSE